MITLFRTLLIASTALFAIVFWMPWFDEPFYSDEALQLLSMDGFEARYEPGLLITLLFYVSGVALPLLMYFFVRWARSAFLVFSVFSQVAALLWGLRVSSPIESAVTGLILLMDGAILAMAYLTSVSKRFDSERS